MTDELSPSEKGMLDAIAEHTRKTRDTALSVTGHGGYRHGAGRKSTGRKKYIIYVTDDEHIKIREYIEYLRAAE